MEKQPRQYLVSVGFEGKIYKATWFSQLGFITVESPYGTAKAERLVSGPKTAQTLLHEILEEAKARGEL